ncbi:chemotaxis protein CheW [Sphingomonas sp. ID0503]|uniref:chemotaxis protein CheW n=1 Tax=Sphingomonas sp. ID0503 TaxID=3399691 RepID=UPI003AFA49D3
MNSLYLIARVAGERIAISADAVQSVVEIDALTPVPIAPRHIAGLSALRSRVLTVIDTYAALGLESSWAGGIRQVVVVIIDGHLYGLAVEDVHDVAEISGEPQRLRGSMGQGWSHVASSYVEYDGQPLLVVNAAALISGPVAAAA